MSALQDFDQKLTTFIKFRPAPTADEQYGAWFATVYEFTEKTAQAMGLANSAAAPAAKVQPVEPSPSAEIALPPYGKLAETKEAIFEQNLRYFDSWPRCWNTNQAADLCDPARRVIECLQLGSEERLTQLHRMLEVGAGSRFLALVRERYSEVLKSYVTQRTLRQMIEDFLAAESRLAPVVPVEEEETPIEEVPSIPKTHLQAAAPTVLVAQQDLWEDATPSENPADEEVAEPAIDSVQNLMTEASTLGQVLSFPELYSLSVENRKKLLIKTLASATDDDWGYKDGLSTCPELLLTAAQALKDFSLRELARYIQEDKQRVELKRILSARKPEHAGFAFWQDLAATHAKAESTASDVAPMVENVVERPSQSLGEEAEVPNTSATKVLTITPDGRYDVRLRFHRETMRAYARALAADIKSLGLSELDVAVRAFGNANGTAIQGTFQSISRIDGVKYIKIRKTDNPEIIRIFNLEVCDEKSVNVVTVKPNGQYDIRSRGPIEPLRPYIRALTADIQTLALPSMDIEMRAFGDTDVSTIRNCFRDVRRVFGGNKFKVKMTDDSEIVRIVDTNHQEAAEDEKTETIKSTKKTSAKIKSTKKGRENKLVRVLTLWSDGHYDVRFRAAYESMSAYARSLMADMEALLLKEFNIAIKAFDEPNLTKIRACFHNIQYRIDTDLVYSVKRTDNPDVVCITSKPESEKKVYLPWKRPTKHKVGRASDKMPAQMSAQTKPELSMPKMREAIEETLLKGSATMDVLGIPEKEVEESLRHLLDRIRYTGAIDYVCADGVLILEKRAVA